MTKDEVVQLSNLARIALSEEEIERLPEEIAAIVDYVSAVKNIIGTDSEDKVTAARYNVLRTDEITHEPGMYTEELLDSAPRRQDNYLMVNKILQQDE